MAGSEDPRASGAGRDRAVRLGSAACTTRLQPPQLRSAAPKPWEGQGGTCEAGSGEERGGNPVPAGSEAGHRAASAEGWGPRCQSGEQRQMELAPAGARLHSWSAHGDVPSPGHPLKGPCPTPSPAPQAARGTEVLPVVWALWQGDTCNRPLAGLLSRAPRDRQGSQWVAAPQHPGDRQPCHPITECSDMGQGHPH